MRQLQIVYIVGAGASQAIDQQRIPGMNMLPSFFKAFQQNWADVCSALQEASIRVTHRGEKIEIADSAKGTFITDFEALLQRLEELVAESDRNTAAAAETAYRQITTLIARLIAHLDESVVSAIPEHPYHLIAKAISERGECHVHSFISFNYDLWLEQSLQRYDLWNAANGYIENGTNPIELRFVGPNNVPTRLYSSEYSAIRVFKPHGCLSWFVPEHDLHQNPVMTLNSQEVTNNGWVKGGVRYIHEGVLRLSEGISHVPLIIPPLLNKGTFGEALIATHAQMEAKLAASDVVVIIGWSMPATDLSMRQFIFDAMRSTWKAKLRDLVVCNINNTDLFYNRFRAIVPSTRETIYKNGFSNEFIEDVLKPIWASQWN